MQAMQRVCKENKELEEKTTTHLKTFIERLTIRYYHRNIKEMNFGVLTCDDAS